MTAGIQSRPSLDVIGPEEYEELVHRLSGILREDSVAIGGSLPEGLGNSTSDLDLLWLTSMKDVPAFVPRFFWAGYRVDVEVYTRDQAGGMVWRIAETPAAGKPLAFSFWDLRLAHSLLHGLWIRQGRTRDSIASLASVSLAERTQELALRQLGLCWWVSELALAAGRVWVAALHARETLAWGLAALLARVGETYVTMQAKWRYVQARRSLRDPAIAESFFSHEPLPRSAGEVRGHCGAIGALLERHRLATDRRPFLVTAPNVRTFGVGDTRVAIRDRLEGFFLDAPSAALIERGRLETVRPEEVVDVTPAELLSLVENGLIRARL